MRKVRSSLNRDLNLRRPLRPCLGQGASWRAGVGRVRSLACLSILQERSLLVPDLQVVAVLPCQNGFSAAC